MTLSANERARYQRHLSLREIGAEGQEKLKAARVLIVGTGPEAYAIARELSSRGEMSRDVIGLLAAAVRDPDPVIFLEHKSLYATKGEVEDGEILDTLGTAKIVRPGKDATIVALALMVPRALAAAETLKAEHGIDVEVVDVRSLVPLDTQTILGSVGRTHRLFTVEENPRLCGWGAEIVSIVADEAFYDLDGPPVRITTPHIPLPAADILEDIVLPTPARIVETVKRSLGS